MFLFVNFVERSHLISRQDLLAFVGTHYCTWQQHTEISTEQNVDYQAIVSRLQNKSRLIHYDTKTSMMRSSWMVLIILFTAENMRAKGPTTQKPDVRLAVISTLRAADRIHCVMECPKTLILYISENRMLRFPFLRV